MKLSIVIPLYNKEKHIDCCMESVLNQDISLNEYEIIIVDDGSTDSSFSIAQQYENKYDNVHLISQKNAGPGAARNKGLESANGDYIYFLDADDYIADNVLNALLELAELNKLEMLVFISSHIDDGTLPNFLSHKLEDKTLQVMDGMTYIVKLQLRNSACLYFLNKRFMTDNGIKFEEGRFFEDAVFSAGLILKIKRVARVNMDVHRYVKVENATTTNTDPAHLQKFMDDIVYTVESFDVLIKNLDSANTNYHEVIKIFKSKQHSFIFSLFIKAFKNPLLNFNDLNKKLDKLKTLGVYPIKIKYGGMGGGSKAKRVFYNMIVVIIINNRRLLLFCLRIMKLMNKR